MTNLKDIDNFGYDVLNTKSNIEMAGMCEYVYILSTMSKKDLDKILKYINGKHKEITDGCAFRTKMLIKNILLKREY